MRNRLFATVVVSIGSVASVIGAPSERTLVFDPVELVAGREAEGDESLAVEHEGYEYRFVSRENRARFREDPWRFAAADGGACGRMGPLSGLGDARRHLVVDKRIWFFASDGCREGFLADPERCIERADPVPEGDDEQRARASQVLSRMVAWAGGRDALGAVRTYQHAIRDEFEREGGKGEHVKEVHAAFPDRFAESDRWDERSWSRCVVGDRGLARSPDNGAAPLARDRSAAFVRRMVRLPISLIVLGGDPDAVAFARGERRVEGVRCSLVDLHHRGATTQLCIEVETGRLVAARFVGRGPGSIVGSVERVFTAYEADGGVTVPSAWRTRFDGEFFESGSVVLDSVVINPTIDDGVFGAG